MNNMMSDINQTLTTNQTFILCYSAIITILIIAVLIYDYYIRKKNQP